MICPPPRSTLFPYTTLFRSSGQPDFGANVLIFDPSMPTSQIQAKVDAIAAQQVDNEMGTQRYALLFKPGTYGSAANPLVFQDRKSTRLNSSHQIISYAVFCLNDLPTTEIYTLSLHDAVPIFRSAGLRRERADLRSEHADKSDPGESRRDRGPAGRQRDGDAALRTAVQARHLRQCRQPARLPRSEEHTSELQSPDHLVCRLLLE